MKPLLFIGALAAPAAALAQSSTPTRLDPIVVTATRSEQPLSQTLAAVSVITREEIERSLAGDVAELLRLQAGVEIARNGGPGQVTSAFIRGGESNHTLVLIDGQRVNPATAGGAALQNLAPALVERIEIVRGPRATLYGSDAIAGVINIITRAPQRTQASASAWAGSHDRYGAAAAAAFAGERLHFSLDAEHEDTDGIPTCESSSLDRGYRRSSVSARAGTTLGGADVEARIWNAQGQAGYLDFCDPAFGNRPLSQDFQNQVAAVAVSGRPLTRLQTQLRFARLEDDIEQNQSADRVRTVRPSVELDNLLELGQTNRLHLGAEVAREEVDARSFGSVIDETRDLWRVYGQDQWQYGAHHLLAGLAYADYEDSGTATTWNLEYGYDLGARTTLVASAGSGFRAPDATDRYGFGGNPALDPERSRSVELGLRQRFGTAQTLDLRLFANEVEDLISVEFDPANDPNDDFGFRAVNIDESRNEGAELSYRWLARSWDLRLGALLQDPRDETADTRLLRRAKRSGSAVLQRDLGRLALYGELLASGARADVDAQTGARVESGGYTLVNVGGSAELARRWQLQARIDNLLDKDYQTAAGFEQPGRSAYVGLRWAY